MASIIIPQGWTPRAQAAFDGDDAQFEVGCDLDAERTALICAGAVRGRAAPPKIPKVL